ncbi:unnamed protein product [Effrenium voratum]|uniref:Uncharacterized protein n=1 Tax=Effrenium voratum TaxID=2562239 RepID=A0AA36JKC7_9DINO|nr:unnamed protein product [Effrenium voratum]
MPKFYLTWYGVDYGSKGHDTPFGSMEILQLDGYHSYCSTVPHEEVNIGGQVSALIYGNSSRSSDPLGAQPSDAQKQASASFLYQGESTLVARLRVETPTNVSRDFLFSGKKFDCFSEPKAEAPHAADSGEFPVCEHTGQCPEDWVQGPEGGYFCQTSEAKAAHACRPSLQGPFPLADCTEQCIIGTVLRPSQLKAAASAQTGNASLEETETTTLAAWLAGASCGAVVAMAEDDGAEDVEASWVGAGLQQAG